MNPTGAPAPDDVKSKHRGSAFVYSGLRKLGGRDDESAARLSPWRSALSRGSWSARTTSAAASEALSGHAADGERPGESGDRRCAGPGSCGCGGCSRPTTPSRGSARRIWRAARLRASAPSGVRTGASRLWPGPWWSSSSRRLREPPGVWLSAWRLRLSARRLRRPSPRRTGPLWRSAGWPRPTASIRRTPGGFGAPPGPPGYGAPPAPYGAPPGGFGAPPSPYGAPPGAPGYGPPGGMQPGAPPHKAKV